MEGSQVDLKFRVEMLMSLPGERMLVSLPAERSGDERVETLLAMNEDAPSQVLVRMADVADLARAIASAVVGAQMPTMA